VRVQQIPWSAAHEKLVTAYVGGAMPDVFQAGNTWLPEFAALDALEPLDDRLARSPALVRGDDFPGILDTNVIDGVTYGVPWYVDTRVLFYRRDLLAAAGHPDPPRTWAAWSDAMARVKARAGPERYAILLPLREWQPPVILALQLGAGLLRDGGWATAPLPAPDGGYPGVSPAGGASLAVFRRSPRQDAAWQLIEYLSEPAQQVRFYRLTGDLPARREAWTEAALERDPQAGAFWTQLEAVRATPKIPEWERIATEIS